MISLILLAVSAVLVVYLMMTTFYRKLRPGEPPIVKGSLIWGSSGDFAKNAVSFLHKATKKYGDLFTIRLINQYVTIIMDPHSYEPMSKEKNFDFDPIQKQVNWNVFSFVLREPKKMIKDTGRTVRGPYLYKGMKAFADNLKHSFSVIEPEEKESREWSTDGLRSLTAKTIFDALFNTIFGNSEKSQFNSAMVYKNFEIFHKYFNFMWLGFPKKLFPPAMRALEELLCQPLGDDFLSRHDTSDYIKTAIAYMKLQGQSEGDIKGHNLVYLHVNYNTFRLAFWVLANLLKDEKALAALREEVDESVSSHLDTETNTSNFTPTDLENMQILDSIVQESTRLASGVFMVRYVNQDTWFETTSGRRNLVRQGDRVAIYPPAIHKDPEIFEDPEEFKYDRFVDATFFKNGQEVKHPIMAFGSLCPGKRYALLQLKWYILNIVRRFELRFQGEEMPEYDHSYHGHEILPPVKDVNVEYRVRQDVPVLELERD